MVCSENFSLTDFYKKFDEMLETYDYKIRPFYDEEKPVVVQNQIYINSLSSMDELKMQISMNVYFRQFWSDPRLNVTNPEQDVALHHDFIPRLWLPDTFFPESKSEHRHVITLPNKMLWLKPGGKILYSQRLSLVLSCPMDLRNFPFDTQICKIHVESYGYSTKDIILEWKSVGVQLADKVEKATELPQFVVHSTKVHESCLQVLSTGNFSCVSGYIHLKRTFGFYFTQIYIPSMLIVCLSWVSFWLDSQAVAARVSLGILTILTSTTQSSAANSMVPRMSYVKGIDIWMSACLSFNFAALLEFAVSNSATRSYKNYLEFIENENIKNSNGQKSNEASNGGKASRRILKRGAGSSVGPWHSDNSELPQVTWRLDNIRKQADFGQAASPDGNDFADNVNTAPVEYSSSKDCYFACKTHVNGSTIDKYSRVLFPSLFLIFNIAYWVYFYNRYE